MDQNRQKLLISSLIFAMFLSWLSWAVVIIKMNPFSTSKIPIYFFYLTSFFTIIFTFTTFSVLLSTSILKNFKIKEIFHNSLERGIIISIILMFIIFFQQFRVLNWKIVVLLFLMGGFLSFFFVGRK